MKHFNRILKKAGDVLGFGNRLYDEVVKLHRESELEYKSEWLNHKSGYGDLYDKPVLGKESTTVDGTWWEIRKDGVVILELTEYRSGNRARRKCKITVKGVPVRILKPYIREELRELANEMEHKEEVARRSRRRKAIYRSLTK